MGQTSTLFDCLKTHLHSILHYPLTASLLFICLTLFLHRLITAFKTQKGKRLPSPPTLPLIGNLHQLNKLLHRALSNLSKRYGPIMLLHFGSVPLVVVSSAEMVKLLKKDQDIAFANRPFATSSEILLHGKTGLASAPYGDYWRELRKICITALLSNKRVLSFNFVREEEVALLIKGISDSCSANVPVNIDEMFVSVSYNIVSRCTTGKKPQGYDDQKKFEELLGEYMSLLLGTGFVDIFPWLGWMTGLSGKMKMLMSKIDTYLDNIIDEHMAESKSDDMDHAKDFVDVLLEFQQDNSHSLNFSRDNIKANILDMYLGGTDTTSVTMQWAMAELLNNPTIMKKVKEEVRSVVGKKPKVDEEDIRRMDYLKCIIKETLRLHPPGPFVAVESFTSNVLNGYHVPARTRVFINAWEVHRDVNTWDKPEEFIPERFIDNPIDFRGQHYEFIPFGSGRRGCPGISFGTAVTELVLANLIFSFDWELPAGTNKVDMSETLGASLHMKTPLYLVPKLHF